MDAPKTVEISAEDVAKELGYSWPAFQKELALLGWAQVMNEAERLAYAEHFDHRIEEKEKTKQRIPFTEPPPPSWVQVIAAAESFVRRRRPRSEPKGPSSKEGYLYVLYDGETLRCKIGCTNNADGKRQRSLMSSHGAVLANVLNAKVKDRYAAETQCHEKFKEYRKGGEWFQASLVDVVNYIHQSVEWSELDFENTARMVQYLVGAELGEPKAVRDALSGNEAVKQGK